MKKERILVIRLGALGDLILCFQAFQDIRRAHPQADIALLTMPAFAGFASLMPWFDRIITDNRPPLWRLDQWWTLVRNVKVFAPTRVYDLQGRFRQTLLYKAVGKPEWSGAAKGCSHPRPWPPIAGMHYTDFAQAQLQQTGIATGTPLDLDWLDAPLKYFDLPKRYALLIPGCAPTRLYKRWPPTHYAELANTLATRGIVSIAIGTAHDAQAIQDVRTIAPNVVDLSGKTSLHEVAALARHADYVIGNDTGPTHLAAAVGARTVALMSDRVDPRWSSPKGVQATWIQGKPLEALAVEEVIKAVS